MPVCAIYARVSDEEQVKGESISHQVSFVREYARRRSLEDDARWETPDRLVFIDEGISGTNLLKRVAVQALLDAAKTGQFEVVLFKGISRFARDTVDALMMLRTFIASNVRVISLEENFDSQRDNAEFIFTIHSALAQAESEKIGIRVRIGAMQKAREGRWNGAVPCGYTLNRATQRLEIDPVSAPLVRRIFELADMGRGPWVIADQMNTSGLYTSRGALWTRKRVRDVLTNPAYAGDVVYGRRERRLVVGDDPYSHRKQTTWQDNPEQLVICRDAHPALIERNRFERVQTKLQNRSLKRGRTGRLHLFTKGLLVCTCGQNMTIKYNSRHVAYYACTGKLKYGKHFCDQRFIRADDLESCLLARIREDVFGHANLTTIHWAVSRPVAIDDSVRSQIDAQIDRELHRSALLFDRHLDGTLTEEQYVALNQNVRARLQTLHSTRDELLAAETVFQLAAPETGDVIKDFLAHVLHPDTSNRHVARECVEQLVQRIDILDGSPECTVVSITYAFTA